MIDSKKNYKFDLGVKGLKTDILTINVESEFLCPFSHFEFITPNTKCLCPHNSLQPSFLGWITSDTCGSNNSG